MSLKKQLGRSTAWMSAAASINSIASFFIFIFISRLLEPKEIGLVAFALIIIEVGKIIVNAGFPAAIIQHPVWDQRYASTCFYLNFILATSVTLTVFFVVTPLVVQYYQPNVAPILHSLSIIFFMEGIKAVHEGKLKREFQFRVIALRTIFGGIIAGVIGITLAFKGYGIWALVLQQIINHSIVCLFTLASGKWLPSLAFSLADGKKILAFSSPLLGAQLIGNLISKTFETLIGLFIGPAALGFYRVGGRALYIVQDIAIKPFENTLLSALSRLSDRAAQASATLRVFRMSSFINFPVFFGAAAIAPEFITLAFGEKWTPSGNIMTLLALGIAPQIISNHINSALTASGNSKFVMMQSVIELTVVSLNGYFILREGLTAATSAYSIGSYFITFCGLLIFKHIFSVPLANVFKIILPSFLTSIIMFASVMLLKQALPTTLPIIVKTILLGSAGALIYALLAALIIRATTCAFLSEVSNMAPDRIKPSIRKLQTLLRFD